MAFGMTREQAQAQVPDCQGRYWCPLKCHDKAYPAPRWKTQAGYLKHLDKCPELPVNAPAPPPPPERTIQQACPACGAAILDGDSVWRCADRIACCLSCITAGPAAYGLGHMDFAGLYLGDEDFRH